MIRIVVRIHTSDPTPEAVYEVVGAYLERSYTSFVMLVHSFGIPVTNSGFRLSHVVSTLLPHGTGNESLTRL